MIGLAAGWGTAVDPTCSTRAATGPSPFSRRLISAAAIAGQSGSYGTIRMAGSNRSSSEGCRSTRRALGRFFVGALGLAELAEGSLALVAGGAIQDQHAVQVVHLVLDHAGLEAGRLHEAGLALLVPRTHAHVHRALHVDRDAGDRQAALVEDLPVGAVPLELRVREGDDRRLGTDAVDEQPL